MSSYFRFIVLAVLLCPSVACVTSKPFLYELKSPEKPGTVYLVGSMHRLPDHEELTPAVVEMLNRVEVIYTEIGPSGDEEYERWTESLLHEVDEGDGALAPNGKTYRDFVTPQTYDKCQQLLTKTGSNEEKIARLRPWALIYSLKHYLGINRDMNVYGRRQLTVFKHSHGTEGRVQHWVETTKPKIRILGLETVRERVNVYRGMSPALQNAKLFQLCNDILHPKKRSEAAMHVYHAFRSGDEKRLARVSKEWLDENKTDREFDQHMIVKRNYTMTDRTIDLLGKDQITNVTVGSGHVVGPEGMLVLLRKRGIQVRRIESADEL